MGSKLTKVYHLGCDDTHIFVWEMYGVCEIVMDDSGLYAPRALFWKKYWLYYEYTKAVNL